MKWKYQRKKRTSSGCLVPEQWKGAGLIGKNAFFDNAHTLTVGENYNGSGGTAFGGAKSWPVVGLKVAFQTGEERKARAFAQRLRLLTEEFCDELDASRLKRSR